MPRREGGKATFRWIKGGFRGNVNILLYYNRLLLYDFQCASAGGVAENGTAYKLACKGLFYFAEQQLCCLKGVASALDYETKKTIDS